MNDIEPENRPETFLTTSPDCVMSLRVASTGSPEPGAVVSYSHCVEASNEACGRGATRGGP